MKASFFTPVHGLPPQGKVQDVSLGCEEDKSSAARGFLNGGFGGQSSRGYGSGA